MSQLGDCELHIEQPQMVRHFHTKIRGISMEQERQVNAAAVRPGDQLALHSPDPPLAKFPHAIEIRTRANETMLGYLSDKIAKDVSRQIEQGWRFVVIAKDTTGGTPDKPTRGINLVVVEVGPGHSEADAVAYINALVARDPELSAIVSGASEESPPQKQHRDRPAPRRARRSGPSLMAKISRSTIDRAKAAWTNFDDWCGGCDSAGEDAMNQYVPQIIRIVRSTGGSFDYGDACDFLQVDVSLRDTVAIGVFEELCRRAWADGVLTDDESQTLKWMVSRLDLDTTTAAEILQRHRTC
jgi:hypothetical protein